jgi:hypothetical protein
MRPLIAALAALLTVATAAYAQPPTTERASVSSAGKEGNSHSTNCDVTDARVVAFDSAASNFVRDDFNDQIDVFVSEAPGGETTRVSVRPDGGRPQAYTEFPRLSDGGRFVAFHGYTYDLRRGGNRNRRLTVFLHDRKTGRTRRASDRSDGTRAFGHSYDASISASGRFVAFTSDAPNVAMKGDENGVPDVFVHARKTRKTNRVSLSRSLGDPDHESGDPDISADGRYVAFTSFATNLIRNDANRETPDIFVYDRERRRTELVSMTSEGEQSSGYNDNPAISEGGRLVSFTAYSSLDESDVNGVADVYAHDRRTGSTQLVSRGDAGPGDATSDYSSISDDGRYVAFLSPASNLVVGDTNGEADVFLRDLVEQTTTRVSVGHEEQQANDAAWGPAISGDGRFVCWSSEADNLVPNDTNEASDVFVRGPLH